MKTKLFITSYLLAIAFACQAQSNLAKQKFNSALAQHNLKNYDLALTYLKDAVSDSPQFNEAYILMADCYDELNQLDQAITTYYKALQLNPQQEKVHFNLARLYISMKQYRSAETALEKAIVINPNYEKARAKLLQLRQYIADNEIPIQTKEEPQNTTGREVENKETEVIVKGDDHKPLPDNSKEQLVIFWTNPDPTEITFENIQTNTNFIDIKLKTLSSQALQPQHFKVFINGVAQDGARPEGEALSEPRKDNNQLSQTYKNRVHLLHGENRIEIQVKNEKGEVKSQTMVVHYTPTLPNLHILAIGTPHADLQYTTRDANDFAAAFKNQQGKLFKEINVTTLTSKEKTQDNAIRESFVDLLIRYQNNQIETKDVLIVFISSHGKTGAGGRFKILPSNYDKRYEDIYTVDFQNDIMDYLNKVNCKKFIFVDACHSGGALAMQGSKAGIDQKALSAALEEIVRAAPGVNTITSCQRNQLSYEDQQWQNGAFTESLLEAFNNKECQDNDGKYRADINDNKILTMNELYKFLQRRVPNLVKNGKPNAITEQVPFMRAEGMSEDLALYILN